MEDDNEDDLKNKKDLHIAGRHTALDIFRFAVFLVLRSLSFFRLPSFSGGAHFQTCLNFGSCPHFVGHFHF